MWRRFGFGSSLWLETCDSDSVEVFVIMTQMADALACFGEVDWLDGVRLLR